MNSDSVPKGGRYSFHNAVLSLIRLLFTAPCLWLFLNTSGAQAQVNLDGRIPETLVSETLSLFALNIAHARGSSLNQLLVTREGHQHSLAAIASVLGTSNIDIVALQEVDAPSWWSGDFDHLQHLAELSDYPASVHGTHAESWFFSYGTALLSRVRMQNTLSHSFKPSWPTATKGYVRGAVLWQSAGTAPQMLTVISVHLDFSRKSVRKAQLAELLADLATLPRPLIVVGDFNADWAEPESPVRELVERAGLQAYRPSAQHLGTYKDTERLDWILISGDLSFRDYRVVPDIVSDHLATVATIEFKKNRDAEP